MEAKAKTAEDILAGVINVKSKSYKGGYQMMMAKSYHSLLDEILTKTPKESELLRHLVSDYKTEMRQGASFSPFPSWARQIAYCIVNPDAKLAKERVQLIRDYCAKICDEYVRDSAQETTKFLAEHDFDFLSQMARVFAK